MRGHVFSTYLWVSKSDSFTSWTSPSIDLKQFSFYFYLPATKLIVVSSFCCHSFFFPNEETCLNPGIFRTFSEKNIFVCLKDNKKDNKSHFPNFLFFYSAENIYFNPKLASCDVELSRSSLQLSYYIFFCPS